jgi:hypothetical protein
MGIFDEMKGDAMKTIGMLGAIFGFVILFFLWSSTGIWGVVALLALVGGGLYLFKKWRGG